MAVGLHGYLASRLVGLDDAEAVALGVLEVGQVADSRNRHLWGSHCPARLLDLVHELIHRGHVDGGYHLTRSFLSRRQPSIDPWLILWTGGDEPVLLCPFPLLERPIKDGTIELDRPFRILRRHVEMHHPRHVPSKSLALASRPRL